MKTLAAILTEQHQALELAEIGIPSLGFGQVLVHIRTSRICGSQLGEIDGVKGPDQWLPHLLGHEGGGVVLEVGPEVRHVKAGDPVVLHWRPGAGIEARPPVYDWEGKKVNAGFLTTFNHLAVVSENRLTRIPADVDFETAALLADTLTTGFGVICRDARLEIGESAVVIGCGGIGLGTVLGARLAGAHPIVAVDIAAKKTAKALAAGATHAVDANAGDWREQVESILGGPADVVVDGTGQPAVIEAAYRLAGPKGRVVLVGVMRHDRRASLNTLPLHFGKILTGSEGGQSRPHQDIPRYLRMLRDGRMRVDDFVTHRGSLREVNDLIAKMRAGEVVHAILHYPEVP